MNADHHMIQIRNLIRQGSQPSTDCWSSDREYAGKDPAPSSIDSLRMDVLNRAMQHLCLAS